jgi:hypothetical protein
MDAISALVGVASDGANGVFAAILLLVPLAASLLLARHRGRREQPDRPPASEVMR